MVLGNRPKAVSLKSSRSNHRTFNQADVQGNPQKALRFSPGRNSGQELLRYYPHLGKLAALIRGACTESIINQDENGFHVRLDVREPNHPPSTIVGFFAPTLDAATQLADEEIVKLGYVCNGKCNRWEQF